MAKAAKQLFIPLCFAGLVAIFIAGISQRPVEASSGQKARGQLLYRQTGCEHCHGADLRGTDLGPDISIIGKQWKKPEIEHQIVHGGGGMPEFGDVLQPDEITALVEFLHSKRKAPKTARRPTAPSPVPSLPAPLQ